MKMAKNTELGLEENVEGLLCYVLGFISGGFFYLIEKKNDFVRFHATQSVIVFLGLFIVSLVLGFVIPFIGPLIGALQFILWLVLMYKAYKGEKYKLPVAGDMAEKYSK